ncbi:receptor-type tyrosine-protein phosphatase delta isoform X1 [Hydra vulgaris]|uniref:receptor-type tyrosine-protein phosphatase delta isoform X1 n=1 Tax=Hydra vulgaris TaxID=6087 RepID=UPI001F5F5F0E|nr:receptor-type tyrosine-protein phosphatase delta isoform X2 [Hydra vulgaris]
MLIFIYCIWFYHGAYVNSLKIIEKFELVECEARSIKLKWQLNNNYASDQVLMVKCSRFDEREKTSTIINMTGFVTINSLAPNTRYKCKLEVFKLSVELDSSNFVYAVTLIGEACIQPVGFETGIIKEDSITSSPLTSSKKRSIRLYDVDGFWCSIDSSPYIRIDLGRIMTITGLLFRTNNTDVDKIYIKYGINTIDQMKDLRFDKVVGENPRTFDYPKNDTTRDWFLENSFTVKLLEFRSFDEKKPFCVQVEVYGCSEICSSKLEPLSIYHILELNTSLSSNTKLNTSLSSNTKLSNLKNVTLTCIETNQSLRFDFGKILTISGFMMLSQNVSLKLRIRYGDIENMTLKQEVFQTFSTNSIPHSYTTFWFNNQILTKDIEVRPVTEITCMYVVFLGCSSANMKKLGIENGSPGITLTESSFYSSFHTAVNGRLNAMMSDWTINDADKNPWYQICFSVIQTVSAIAVQGQGYWSPAYITGFSIEYGYSANTVSYIYSFNGLPYCFDGTKNRYATSVNQFPVEISAQCLRIVKMKYFRSASGRFEVLGNNITYPPNIIMPKLVFNIKNSTAFVKCVVIGQPGLIIQWRKQNEIIVYNNLNYTIVTSNRSIDINGTYTSELTIKPLVHLNVDNDDNFCHGDIKNVSCFFNYSISTGYTSTNLFVTNTSLIYYGFDAEIDSPNLTIIATNVSINITWTTEKFKRDFQVFYNFSLIEHDGSNNITRDNNISIENIVVYDAKPYTSYTFQLTAFNRLGRNPNIFKKFLSEEGYPSVIQNFIALATSKENISLNWNHPKCQNGIITIYTVEYAEINLTSSMLSFSVLKENLVNQSFAVVVGQLKNYQKYMFRVNAYTNHGKNSGEWSEWIEETTLEGNPSVVRNLTASAISKENITLKWYHPEIPNGIITNYTVEYGEFESPNITSLSFLVFKSHFDMHTFAVQIEQLKNYRKYKFRVNAFTNHGLNSGEWSEWINETTFEGNPSIVRNFTASAISKEKINLTWHHPETFNGVITNYIVEYKEFNSSNITSLTILTFKIHFDTPAFTTQVKQLKNYQKYEFRVKALTNHGMNHGEWSEWVDETTFEGIPSVPEDLIGNVSSSRDISLRWNEPKQLNGIVRSYTVAYSGFKPYNLSFEHNEKIVVNSTQVLISSLYPGTNYTISVNAETIVKGPSSKINITLPYDEPFAPILLKLENQISEQTTIVLHSVPSFTGPISHYEFDIQESSSNCLNNSNTTIKLLYTLEYNQLVIPKGEENITFQTNYIHLSLIGKFCICYRAVINDSGILYMGKIAYLDLERNDLAKIKREEINVDFNSISLRLSQGPLSTKYYQIIVSKGNITNKDPPPSELYPYDEKNDIYLAAEFNASEFMYYENFIVGDGKIFRRFKIAYSNFYNSSYEVLQNVKLQDGEIYSILQRANEHETKYYSTPWLNIQTHKVPIIPETTLPTITSKERTATKGSSISVIGAVSGTALCIIIIVAVIVVLFKRRQKRESPYKKAGENTKLVPLAFKNPSFQSDDEKQKSLEKKPCVKAPIVEKLEVKILEKSEIKKPPETIIVDSSHPPISLKDFAKHWDRLQKDNNCSLSEEYKCLNNGQLYTWDDALLPDVKLKNRYANIVAYDHSRVRLGNSSDVKQNYINASFIHGYTKRNVYIATQGPNISSSNDFWKMIWEQDVPVIVMLTNLVEKGKKKCELYWPTSDAKIFGDVEVTISATDNFSDYVIRKFSIKKVSLEGIKLVHHFQFLHWPDHGAPEFVSDIVLFRHRIRKIFPYEYTQNPVVVHCSAGVGRTGTFICIDEMLELLKRQNKVDIFNYVNFMRSRRIFMIQTEDQYLFVYRAIFESITCGITETMASDFPQLFAGLSKVINLKSGTTTGFEEQFERLKMFISSPVPEDFSNALKDVNKVKNCNQEILASDEKRVLLLDGIYEEGGDYINAVYINGFKRINEYIATQHPLTSTLSDFWTMVFQKKIGTIVMLHDSCKESRLPQLHGVLKHKNEFKNVSVTLNYQEIKGCITFKNLQVNSLNGKDIVECVILCLEWPIDGVPIKNDVITLINEMEKQQSKHGENPVLVVCSDGASRCGTFLACSIILHHLQLEQAVDVFQTIRKIRTSRSQFVNNVIHFKFCYELALTYIDSFNSYSNYIECKT